MRTRLPFSVLSVCILIVASAPLSAQSTAEARKSYDAALRDAKRAFLRCDATQMAMVTEDYTGVNEDGHVTKGRAAELKADRDFCAANTITAWDVTTSNYRSSGPIAWAAGTLRMTWKEKASGKVRSLEGRYLATYARQPDGTWQQQYFMSAPGTAMK